MSHLKMQHREARSEAMTVHSSEVLRRGVLPAIVLFFLAPLVSEFLLGDLPLNLLPALIVLAPMYGGAALLVREGVRHTGRGWPSIVTLGLVFAIFEEAFTTQTLFNPNYLGLNLHLLRPAYIPVIGMGGWWTVYVLTLHTVWSISTSIALTEVLFPDRETTPWLGRPGLIVTSVLLAVGATVMTRITLKGDRFVAPLSQFVGAAVICGLLAILAFRLPKATSGGMPGNVPSPWVVGAVALAAGSAFMLVPPPWGWTAVAVYLALDVVMITAVYAWSRRSGWDARHRLSLAGGAALTYAWHSFPQKPVVPASATLDLVGNIVFSFGAVFVIWMAARRRKTAQPASGA
jgi:hypothetical protein